MTLHLIETAVEISRLAGGALDPTIGPVVKAWGFYTGDHRIPDDEELARSLELVNPDRIQINPTDSTATISDGIRPDLEALAKGYAARVGADSLF